MFPNRKEFSASNGVPCDQNHFYVCFLVSPFLVQTDELVTHIHGPTVSCVRSFRSSMYFPTAVTVSGVFVSSVYKHSSVP